jgi:acetyl coenzyme A synthetase (ADP forming)-like protein
MDRPGEHDIVLRDGMTIHVRPIRPDDDERLLAFWRGLSPESRRRRFVEPFDLDEGNVRGFVELDEERAEALVGTLGRGADERIVGLARYERHPDDPRAAEFGVAVADEHQRRGIGKSLMRQLALSAREHGVERFAGIALEDNLPALRLMADLGLRYDTSLRAGGVVETSLQIEDTSELLEAMEADEREAAQAALERFFRPRSVALVGASREPLTIGGLLFSNLLAGKFSGAVYPVNAKAGTVQSVAAYKSLSDCPTVPDLVIVSVPARFVIDVVDEAGRLGSQAVCIITAGFAEANEAGVELQRELMQVARSHGLRIIGPNCMGLANAAADFRMNGTFSTVFPAPGRVSFSSQSGAMGLAVLDHLDRLGLGVATFASVGNKADISGNDLLLYWEDDPDTDVILLYLESFGNPRRFSRIARRISRRKPIVAVKSARTGAGVRAASSHTAALAAGDVAVEALFRQAGVVRTDTLEELFDVATLLASQPLPRGRRVGILTNGGGPGILAADACVANGLEVPTLAPETQAALREHLAPEAGVSNPVDMIASGGAHHYRAALPILGQAEEVDAVIVIFIPPIYTRPEDVARALVEARADVPAHKPVLSVFMSAKGVPADLAAARIPSFPFPEEAARALGHVARYGEWRDRPLGRVVRPEGLDAERARDLVTAALDVAAVDARSGGRRARDGGGAAERTRWLDAEEAIELLRCYGITLARGRIVSTPEEGAEAQREIERAVAVKAASSIHKTDVGALRLGLETPEEVAEAIGEMAAALRDAGLGEHADRWLVQEMIGGGVEMVVGVSHDPSFGPLVMVGMGGTLVELHQDVAVRITPLTDVDVRDMLSSLRMSALLRGYRGSPPADVAALEDLLHRVGAMVEDLPEIAELDLNPLFVRRDGVVAVDVRIRLQAAG